MPLFEYSIKVEISQIIATRSSFSLFAEFRFHLGMYKTEICVCNMFILMFLSD